MKYVVLSIVVIVALIYFWKYALILLFVFGVGCWIYRKISKSKQEADSQSNKTAHSLALLGDRLLIKSELEEENEKIRLVREIKPLLDWKSLKDFNCNDDSHFDFIVFISRLATDITFFLGAEAVVDRTAMYQCPDLTVDCYLGTVNIQDFSILFQWDHPDDEPDVPDRMLVVSHKKQIVMRCTEWNEGDSSAAKEKTILLLPASANKEGNEKRFVVNTFIPGKWIDCVLSLEPEVMARMRAQHREND